MAVLEIKGEPVERSPLNRLTKAWPPRGDLSYTVALVCSGQPCRPAFISTGSPRGDRAVAPWSPESRVRPGNHGARDRPPRASRVARGRPAPCGSAHPCIIDLLRSRRFRHSPRAPRLDAGCRMPKRPGWSQGVSGTPVANGARWAGPPASADGR